MGTGRQWVELTKLFFLFYSTKFKLTLFDETRHNGVGLCEKILKRPAKLITELKTYHQSG